MPNYAWNTMTMKCRDFKAFVANRDTNCDARDTVDFNVLIPKPNDISPVSGTETDRAFLYFTSNHGTLSWEETLRNSNNALAPFDRYIYDILIERIKEGKVSDEEGEALYKQGEELHKIALKYGAYDWYDWCYKNWGTKWNAFDFELEYDDEEDDGNICFKFTTAWGAPEEWIKELSRHCDFDIYTDIEGYESRYKYVCENGVLRAYKTEYVEFDI